MASQGGGGAYEISQRMTAMVGWAAVSRVDQFVFDGAAERYALDTAMPHRAARAANPEAFKKIKHTSSRRRDARMWDADDAVLERLRDLYAEADDTIEGVGGGAYPRAREDRRAACHGARRGRLSSAKSL